jgi:hypothetical protein
MGFAISTTFDRSDANNANPRPQDGAQRQPPYQAAKFVRLAAGRLGGEGVGQGVGKSSTFSCAWSDTDEWLHW